MFSIEKRRLMANMITLLKYLKNSHTGEGQDLFSVIPECKACNNGLKLQEDRFWLNIRKKLPAIVVQQWNELPLEVVV